ncbi:MAG: UPF0262 family protein [Alphaproteobacteria bacterium]
MNNIIEITLEQVKGIKTKAQIEYERNQAIADLLNDNYFEPLDNSLKGPWRLDISVEKNHICLKLIASDEIAQIWQLPQAAFRSIVKDYFIITDSYAEAINSGNTQRIEAIDMGRRGIHNEGAQILMEHLEQDVQTDLDTARRLFTLICILHIRG